MSTIRTALPVLFVILAGCPAPPPPAAQARDRETASPDTPPPADAGAPHPRDFAQPPPADAAVAVTVSVPPPIDAGAAPVTERVPAKGCWKPGDPRIAKLQTAADAWTKASFEGQLRRQGLSPAKLGHTQKTLHRGIGGYGNEPTPVPMGTVVGGYIAGGSYWNLNGQVPQPWELVKNSRNEIFHLERRPVPGGSIKKVILCGCAAQTCGPYGSGCPACGATIQEMYGPLPAGATYKGDARVVYGAASVQMQYEHGYCPRQRPCPPPPP